MARARRAQREPRTLLLARRVFTGIGDAPIAGGGVLVEGDRILAAGKKPAVERLARGAHVIDFGDRSLLPGLMNLHAHLDSEGDPDFLTAVKLIDEQTSTLLAVDSARQSVRAGATTVRDLGNKYAVAIAVRDAIGKGWVEGPRILAAGKVVCMTGGHGWFIGYESDGPHEMRKAVRQNLKLGADCIKVIASGGVLSPGVEVGAAQLDEDELTVAVREAHKAGRRVAAHAIANAGIKNALRAGVDTIEHGCFLDDEAVQMMKKAHAWFVPTLCAPHALYAHRDAVAPYAARKTVQVYDAHRESFKLALRKGVQIACGTDAGTPFNRHADFALELALMAGLGMPPEHALRAATSDAAKAAGIEQETGSLVEGKCADLVVADGDPRRDIATLQRVVAVMARGRWAKSGQNA
ncbi:MAG TPA: amidohydrolase family protein [Candidatus Eremiobacteraceae bacterium]|nr:amidohydrolase family protein [Candidatus Eremiobacteraceae bacterium]